MVMRYGMEPSLGPVVWEREPNRFLEHPLLPVATHERSEATAQRADAAMRELMDRARRRAHEILRGRRGALDRAAQRLLQQETLTESEVRELASAPGAAPPVEHAAAATAPSGDPPGDRDDAVSGCDGSGR